MANNFNNVNMGQMNVDIDTCTFGYTKEGTFNINSEFWELKDDFPEVLAGKSMSKFGINATAKGYEMSAHHHLVALGLEDSATILENTEGSENTDYYKDISDWSAGATIATGDYMQPVSLNGYLYEAESSTGTTDASEPTWPTTLAETVSDGGVVWECINYGGELLTFSSYNSGSSRYVEFEGYNLSSADTTVYNSDYTATFTVDVDFALFEKDGQLIKLATGTLGDSEAINTIYKYTPYTSQQVNHKTDDFNTQRSLLRLHQTNPNTAKKTELVLWDAQGQGVDLDMPETEGSSMNLNWTGFEDAYRTRRKLGYLKIET